MHRPLAAVAAVAALAITPGAALAQGQNPNRPAPTATLTLAADPVPVVFGSTVTISGRLSGSNRDAGAIVRLEADDTRPYGDSYREVARGTTEQSGRYAFAQRPPRNTQYRVIAQAGPNVTSPARLVTVRYRVGLIVSDQTPRRGSLVRFSGSVLPPADGRTVVIQRRSSTGRFVTVARTTLQDAGDVRSSYSRRIRVFSDGVYRVKVVGDLERVNGFSRTIALDVG